jgi:hypothetical protein
MTQLAVVFAINGVGLILSLAVAWTVPDVTVETVDNLTDGHAVGTMVGGHIENLEDGQKDGSINERVPEKVEA